MSSGINKEELLSSIEAELKSQMPEECFNQLKKFTLCKNDHDAEIKKTKGEAFYREYTTEPYSRVEGCKNEFDSYSKCYFDFLNRYKDLKNYVAEIEGKAIPFNKETFEYDRKNMTKFNIGLNKF